MKQPIDVIREQHPPLAGEPEVTWRKRLTESGIARFVDRASVRDPREYKSVEAECEKSGALMVVLAAEEPTFAPSAPGVTPVTITRAEARDVRKYMAAKEAAAKAGADLVVTDD